MGVSSVYWNGGCLGVYPDFIRPGQNALRGLSVDTCQDYLHQKIGRRWLQGGPLEVLSFRKTVPYVDAYGWHSTGNAHDVGICWEYKGMMMPIFCNVPVGCMLPNDLPPGTFGDISSLGPEAWNKFRPNFQSSGLSVFLAELREAPRMLEIRARDFRRLKGLGNQYLNAQFGWKPFIADVRKMIHDYISMENRLRNLVRNNGQWQLCRGSMRSNSETLGTWEGESYGAFFPAITTSIYGSIPRYSGSAHITQDVWFSGRFRYYVEDLNEKMLNKWSRANIMRKLFGLTITPAMVWELIPWSWLVDWFTNAGEIIKSLDNSDNCVAKYAYLMGTTTQVCSQLSTATLKHGSVVDAAVVATWERKSRVAADPFGFGMSGDLSARQLAILSALGITRFR